MDYEPNAAKRCMARNPSMPTITCGGPKGHDGPHQTWAVAGVPAWEDPAEDMRIADGDRVEVCEGSWVGRVGTAVVDQREGRAGYVFVRWDKGGEDEVKACTLAEYVDD